MGFTNSGIGSCLNRNPFAFFLEEDDSGSVSSPPVFKSANIGRVSRDLPCSLNFSVII